MSDGRPKYYTTFQASKLLGVSLATVVNWTKADLLQAHRTPGGHRRIKEEDLVEFARAYSMPIDDEVAEAHGGGTPRILLVDDDEDYLDTVRSMLELERGYAVETARSGFAAGLAVASFRPNCIILDIRMPGMDGFEVAQMLREKLTGKGIPVLACTAYSDPKTKERIQRDFDGYLEKPLDIDQLMAAVERALSSRRSSRSVS